MSILQTELAEHNNSKILPVKIKIGFFSIVINILLLCFFFLQELTFSREQSRNAWSPDAVYTHTHTGWLLLAGSQLAAVLAGAVGSVCVWGGGGREWIMTSYSGIWPTAVSCVCSVKKRKEIFLSGIRPKCSGLHSYSITKKAYMKDLRKLYTLKKLNFKAQQNGQNWNLISGMCFTMDFLMMILIEPYHCNLISAIQLV